ncbi:hypothetical protein DFH06DRAFT_1369603 [Mycena polygramma]|nr:hypothetical protein DFH06DRAFT_1369603 [Mycena polygramma]
MPALTPVQSPPQPSPAQELTLPPELWINIHQFVVSDILPLAQVLPNVDGSVAPEDPLNELQLQRVLDAARSLTSVCQLWNNLAQELLYENIWVRDNERWPSLHNALQRPRNARVVRAVRLSSMRFDHNVWVLQRCANVTVLVLPDSRDDERFCAAPNISLPLLSSLKHLCWAETSSAATLLPAVLAAAPNVEQISLARKVKTPKFVARRLDLLAAFPPLPSVRSLSLIHVRHPCLYKVLSTTLPQLTHLTICLASLDENSNGPVLPTVRVLTLVPDPSEHVSFPMILRRFPALCELRYHVSNPPLSLPVSLGLEQDVAEKLVCVRLHLPLPAPAPTSDSREDVARRNTEPPWSSETLLQLGLVWRHPAPVEDMTATCAAHRNVQLLLHPVFPALQRVVLDGPGWGECVNGTVWAGLRVRGCLIEEGVQ